MSDTTTFRSRSHRTNAGELYHIGHAKFEDAMEEGGFLFGGFNHN